MATKPTAVVTNIAANAAAPVPADVTKAAKAVVTASKSLDKQITATRAKIEAFATAAKAAGFTKLDAGKILAAEFGAKSISGVSDGFIAKAWKAACEKIGYTKTETPNRAAGKGSTTDKTGINAIQAVLKGNDAEDIAGAFYGLPAVERMKIMLAMFDVLDDASQAKFLVKAGEQQRKPAAKAA